MGYARAIVTNTAWLMVGKLFVVILSLIMTAALTRSLGVFNYGELTAVFAYLSIFGVIADFGFFYILVREITRRPEAEATITNNIFTLRTVFGLLIYSLAASTVWLIPTAVYGETVKFGVMVLALASFLLSINTTLIGVFQAHQEMAKAVIGDVVSRAVLLGLLLWSLAVGWPLTQIFGLYVFANLLNLLVTFIFLRRRLKLRFAWDRKLWRVFFIEAWPLGVVTMLSIIYFKMNLVLLSVLKSPTDVGIYGASFKIFEFLIIVPSLFMGTVFPVITRLIDVDKERLRRVIQAAYDTLLVFVVGAAVGLIVLARGTIELLAGSEFVKVSTISLLGYHLTSVDALIILSLALLPVYLGNLWGPIVVAFGRQSDLIRPGLVAVILNIGFNLLLIPQGSYVAAALVTLITETYIAWSWSRIARRNLPVKLHHGRALRTVMAALVMGLVIWPMNHLFIIIPTAVGALIYLLLIWALGVIPKEIFEVIRWRGRPA